MEVGWIHFKRFVTLWKTNTFLGMVVGVNECSSYEIRVFWWFLAFCWLNVVKKHGIAEICAVSGQVLAFLWLKVAKKNGMSKICAVLGAQISFCGWAFLLGLWTENRVPNCIPFCYWKGANFAEENEFFGQFCVNFGVHRLHSAWIWKIFSVLEGRAESALNL